MAAAGASGLYVNPNTGAAQAGLAPFRNALINGDMRINQRGTSANLASLSTVATASPGSFVTDRWNAFRAVFAAGGVMGQGTNLTTGDLPFNDAGIKTFARVGRLSGNAATDPVYFAYNMESQDCYRFIGKTVTLSFYYRTGANFSGTSIIGVIRTGAGIDQNQRTGFTQQTTAGINTYNSSALWQKISLIGTIGTNITQIGIMFQYTPVGTSSAADYFDITGVQLELGSVATPFEVRPYPVELQLCQRYCYRIPIMASANSYSLIGIGSWISANLASIYISIPVTLRSSPSIFVENGFNSFAITPGGQDNPLPVTSISLNNVNANAVRLAVSYSSAGQTAGTGTIMYTNNQLLYSLIFPSEL